VSEEPRPTVLRVVEDAAARALCVALSDGSTYEIAIDSAEARDIVPGLELEQDRREGLRRAERRKLAARKVFGWLDRRPRTREELRRRLAEAGFDDEIASPVLDRFEAEGLVDDRRFAEQWGRERLRNRPVGPRWLAGRLRQEGIDPGVVRAVVDELYAELDESELAERALRKRRLDCDTEAGRGRAARFLGSRGFSTGSSIEAIRRVRQG
jgi:regulatory protein